MSSKYQSSDNTNGNAGPVKVTLDDPAALNRFIETEIDKKQKEIDEHSDREANQKLERFRKSYSIKLAWFREQHRRASRLRDQSMLDVACAELQHWINTQAPWEIHVKPRAQNIAQEGTSATLQENDLVGQHEARRELEAVVATARLNKEKASRGLKPTAINFHSLFVGNPGTGKTTFARFYASQIKQLGVLSKGQLVECGRSDLVAGYMGQTAAKTAERFKEALGGILFIDEAYSLKNADDDSFGQEAIDTLLKLMEDHRDQVIVILAGYAEEMRSFLNTNPGLKSRVPNWIHFRDFTDGELREILEKAAAREGYAFERGCEDLLLNQIISERRGGNFGNARSVRNVLERAIKKQNTRIAKGDVGALSANDLRTLSMEDVVEKASNISPPECMSGGKTPVSTMSPHPLAKLEALEGLVSVKDHIAELRDFIEIEKMRNAGSPDLNINLHMTFLGRPGTGKTTVARILGDILRDVGALPSGHVVECDRSVLVGSHLGETAIKTKKKIEEAIGGILFVDEAYTLATVGGNDYGQECIDTIMKGMEDYRDKLVCIFAGYEDQMRKFLGANPGLTSRVPNHLKFEDYTPVELAAIALKMVEAKRMRASSEVIGRLSEMTYKQRDTSGYANARTLRNIFEETLKNQARRLVRLKQGGKLMKQQLNELILADVESIKI